MKLKTIDNINVGLILLSLLAAFILPFSLFLFSYAVFGPLHYLTEINWLNRKNFYIKERKWIILFVGFAAILSLPVVLNLPGLNILLTIPVFHKLSLTINGYGDLILISCLLFAIGLVHFAKWQHLFLFLISSTVISYFLLKFVLLSFVMVGLFLPTIVHVYLFTLFFVIAGALKSNHLSAWMGAALLLLTPLLIYFYPLQIAYYLKTESSQSILTANNFRFVQYLSSVFSSGETQAGLSIGAIKVQVFIAFCYTYHYLNWFSKTSLIGWHKNVSKSKLITIVCIWVALLLVFLYDYEIAYLLLFFLALLHIVLEFPLNIISIKEIVGQLKAKLN